MSDTQQITQLLESHGIIPTRQRIDLARILFARPQHLSAEQLTEAARVSGDYRVSKATVYNTLNLFAERGLLREIIADPTKVFYDSTTTQHAHLYNIDSGELIDLTFTGDPLTVVSGFPEGVQTVGVDIVVRVKNSD
ncbi:MAG TPA: transcriptional repressor [Gammaproteobacteria bacterium]